MGDVDLTLKEDTFGDALVNFKGLDGQNKYGDKENVVIKKAAAKE